MTDQNYIGVEIDGTEQTLSKDIMVTFNPDGTVAIGITDADNDFSSFFTKEQLDAALRLLAVARRLMDLTPDQGEPEGHFDGDFISPPLDRIETAQPRLDVV